MHDLISLFIDDELTLDDKMTFVERVHTEKAYKDDAMDLLQQEKLLCADVVDRVPSVHMARTKNWIAFFVKPLRPVGLLAAGFAAAILVMLLNMPSQESLSCANRFVLYQPDVEQVEISGTFTDWKRIPLQKIGSSGYWDITLNLPQGEHRFTYIIEGDRHMLDPTISIREQDDFGGWNSIILKEVGV